MVFESVVTDILNRVLGDFIENLDSKQLNLGIWGGDVKLKDLILKQSAVDELDLPLQIAYGRLGNLTLKIPWKNLYSSATEASIDGLYLILVPNREIKYDPVKEEKKLKDAKHSALAQIEERKKREAELEKTDDTFLEKLIVQIIKNLQVKVTNIHVRYEDKITNPGHPFAIGITLNNLAIDTTDEDWKPTVVEEIVTKIYKAVQLDALAVYWNCDSVTYSHLSPEDVVQNLIKETATNKFKPENFKYILEPIMSSVRLKLNPKPEKDKPAFTIPKVHLLLEMEKLGIGLSKEQYGNLIKLVDSMDLLSKGIPYRKYRPNVPSYRGYYKEWWLFAYTCILEGEVRRKRNNWNWDRIKKHRQICREYADIYKQKLLNEKLDVKVKESLQQCEDFLDVTNIVIIKHKVELQVERMVKSQPKPKGWFSNWWWTGSGQTEDETNDIGGRGRYAWDTVLNFWPAFSWWSSNDEKSISTVQSDSVMKQFQSALTPEEKERLFKAIDYQENLAPTEYPESYVDMSGVFVLKTLVTEIYDTPKKVLSSRLTGVRCRLETRAGGHAIKIGVNVDSLTAEGVKQEEYIPVLIAPMNEEESLLDIIFESNPLDKKCGQRLRIELKPLRIVYDAKTLVGIINVFVVSQSSSLEKLSSVAATKLNNIKKMSASGLQHIIESHAYFDVNINISAPIIIVPQDGRYTGNKNILAINLGKASIKSVERSASFVRIKELHQAGVTNEDILKEMIEKSYDRFLMSLTEVQVVLASPTDNWMLSFIEKENNSLHLLQPLSLEALYSKCLIQDDPQLPLSTVKCELPSLAITITDTRLIQLIGLIDSVAVETNLPENKPLEKKSSSTSLFQYMEMTKAKPKSVNQSKSSYEPTDVNQFTELDIQFLMKELTLTMGIQHGQGDPKNLAKFSIKNIECGHAMQTFNTETWLKIGSMNLIQYIGRTRHLDILNTPLRDESDYMFTLQFVQVDKSSPEFHTKHQSCETRLVSNFNSLDIHLNQEALLDLTRYVSNVQLHIEQERADKNRIATSTIDEQQQRRFIETIAESTENMVVRQPIHYQKDVKRRQNRSVIETIRFKLLARLDQVKICLSSHKNDIASLSVSGINAEIVLKDPYTQIKAQLLDLSVLNLNPEAIHTRIITVTSEEAVNVQIVSYNLDEDDYTSTNMSIDASIGCLRAVFLNKFVTEILSFLNNFQTAVDILAQASQTAAAQAKLNVEEAISKSMKVAINVNLRAPNIVIPVHSQSVDALFLDFGRFTLSNKFKWLEQVDEKKQNAVLDDMMINLEDMKIAKITYKNEQTVIEHVLLDQLSFQLKVIRNLSSWYRQVPGVEISMQTKTVAMLLAHEDYTMVLDIIEKNINEGGIQHVSSSHKTSTVKKSAKAVPEIVQKDHGTVVSDDPTAEIYTLVKFTFIMERFVFSLFSKPPALQKIPPHDPSLSLAKFSLEMISVKGRIYSDDSMGVAMLLVNCIIEDTRPESEGLLTRLCERKPEPVDVAIKDLSVEESNVPQKYMVDIVYQRKGEDNFADIRIWSFGLIFSANFMMEIYEFLKKSDEEKRNETNTSNAESISRTTLASAKSAVHMGAQAVPSVDSESLFTLNLRIEKPDIVLVEHLKDMDTNALILNFEMLCKLRITTNHQVINCSVNDLQMYTCAFDPSKREDTKANVVFPININVAGSTPEGEGLHIEVHTSDVRIRVSPVTIDLLNRVNKTLIAHSNAKKDAEEVVEDYSDLWQPKPYKEDNLWFLKVEMGEDVSAFLDVTQLQSEYSVQKVKKKELCLFMIQSIVFTMEAGVGKKTLPMLFFDSKFSGNVKNWSSDMSMEASITLTMGYYNSRLALWEPLVEPVQVIKGNSVIYEPWELKVDVHLNPEQAIDEALASPSSEMDELMLPPPPMVVNVWSASNLEITVTKTFLDVLKNLSAAFDSDITGKEEKKITHPTSLFKVINETGLKIILVLVNSSFRLHGDQNPNKVTLESGAQAPLELKSSMQQEMSKVQYQLTSHHSQKSSENFLFVQIENFEKELKLPFERADKRYFPLDSKANKGLISEVTMEHGVLSLTLRSILKIFNHFTIPVDVYYMTEKSNNLAFIFNVQPGQSRNLPYRAVYTATGQLFFSVKNYSVTSVPFAWRDLNSNVTITKTLMCRPKDHLNHTEPFLLNISGKMKQVYSETSTRYTMASVCYNIYVKPVVIFKNYLPFNVVCIVDKLVDEYVVEPGAYAQLPNVQPGTSSICIKIPDYLEKEWTCKNELLQNPSEFTVWQFSSYESIVKVNLDLGMHCKQDGGSTILSLYCPFWLNNKTGLTLDYRKSKKEKSEKASPSSKTTEDNMNVITHPTSYNGPILFSFNAKNFFGKKKASIRVENGDWSDKFPLDVAGSSGYVVCKGQKHIYTIGVRNTLTYNGLTKQVTFTPYYVVVNNAKFDIECREFDRPADSWFTIPAKSCVPFWPKSEKDDKLVKLRVANTEETTPPFLITQTNNILLQLNNKYGGIHADVLLTESSTYINLSPYAEGLPAPMILNHTDKTISYWEKETVQIRKLDPGHSVLFTWSNPPGCRVLAWDIGNKKEMQDELQTDGLKEFSPMPNYTVYWVSFLNGMQRVILFTLNQDLAENVQSAKQFEVADREINVSIHGIGMSLVNNVARQELMYLAIANSGIIWEFAKLKSNRYIEMAVRDSYLTERAYQRYLMKEKCDTPDFGREMVDEKTEVDFDTLMMLKPQQRKIRRVFQYGLWIQMKTSPYQLQFHAKVNKVQIDNQLFDCIFPIVLAPVPPPRTMGDNFHRPFIEMSVVQRVMKYSHITQFKYFKVLIQEFHVKVDIGFVIALLELFETNVANEEEERKNFLESIKLTKEPLKSLVVTISQQEQKSFYDVLHFSPLKIHVSFSLQSGNYKGLSQLDVVNVLLQGLGVTLTDMQDVIFKLAYFERNYTFLSQNQLISEVSSHYSNQAIKQLYVLVLGLDVLGNPYGLVLGITKGFEDFFYEPIQGAIQGPGEFAEGLVLGARSLFSHTVGGAAGAVSRITGAMGKGIAALTFDKDYQRRRRDAMTKKPASVQEGLARGGKGLVMGVVDGVTGVFMKPISGAKHDGVEGFFKGLGKGAIGLITRPTAGIIDFAGGSLDAVKRATDLQEEISRIRPSRSLPADGLVRPYNIQEAEGNKILMELEKGKYFTTDIYVAHFIIEKNQVLLMTDKRIALASHSEVFGGWQAEWAFAWSDIPSPAVVHPKGVQIPIPEAKKKKFGMFGSNGANKLISVQNDALKEKIVNKIEYMREKA